MNLLETQDWTFPVPIAYGPGRLKEIAAMCGRTGMSRPLLVTDQGSEGLFELRSVHEYGHASFGEDVVATALSDLISRAASTLRLAQR